MISVLFPAEHRASCTLNRKVLSSENRLFFFLFFFLQTKDLRQSPPVCRVCRPGEGERKKKCLMGLFSVTAKQRSAINLMSVFALLIIYQRVMLTLVSYRSRCCC